MEFYTVFHEPRPVRLSEKTRQFAWESMHGKYGDEAMQYFAVKMDDIEGFEQLSAQEKYNLAIMRIAEQAPIRICEAESVSGAATLGLGIGHQVSATFGGNPIQQSVSHHTPDFQTVVNKGVRHLEEKLEKRLAEETDSFRRMELLGMKNVVDAMHVWHKRYLEALRVQKPENAKNLERVPFEPPTNFREAVQSVWFTFAFMRLCGNWPGIGRLDEMLGPYLKKDLAEGTITLDEAREFLAGFFIKGCEWIQSNTPVGSGDAQHYQNLVLGGVNAKGEEVTNEVTYLILDIVEELGISDFPISVRVGETTPPELIKRMAEVIRHGGGIIALYNEALILRSLTKFGYSLEEARRFANDGCWEIQVPGKTDFGYFPFDGLRVLLDDTLHLNTDTPAHFDSFEALYQDYLAHLDAKIQEIAWNYANVRMRKNEEGAWEWKETEDFPTSLVSLFEEGCIEHGRSYYYGGPEYVVRSPHIGGAADVANSFLAIDRLVFQEKKVTFDRLMQILQENWENDEELRQYVQNEYVYYGNDNDEADSYIVRLTSDFADLVMKLNNEKCPIRFPAGISTFGRQIEWAPFRAAVPFGRKQGEILSGNISPTPGTDATGATAQIRSCCKIDLEKQVNGAALDVKLHPTAVQGENGVTALMALLMGFVHLGGSFMQLDVMDAEVLRKAQEDPEAYKTLSVRVSGWNARFVTLNKKWQNMVIERTARGI